ncbi:MAG TPA: SDR family NAD(P)-dependent oxidoreductase [Candidatus Binataceae bacterium]|nr:SDR family NAD(P)-dependent oxidoreductase [Candidatus Binataceae bacterium]
MLNVIVTGASRGLGLAMTHALAAVGYRVIAVARNPSDQLKAADRTAGASGAIEFRPFDLSNLEEIGDFVRNLRADFGTLYGLVNNAGLGSSGMLSMMPDTQIEQLIRLNSSAPILLSKYVARSMMTARSGRIINIASIVASSGYSGLSVYGATKASLIGFSRSLARELGPLGITVNAIAPGFIATDMTAELTEANREQIMRRSALMRMADASDVAQSVVFLMGEAGRNITGTVLTIDAGNTA